MDGSMSRPPSSQVNSQRSFSLAKHLTLHPTGTDAFPSILDGLDLWPEGEGGELDSSPHLVENFQVPQDSEVATPIHTPPLSGDQSPAFYGTLATRHSSGFMQRMRKAGARIKGLVTRHKRSRGSGELTRSSSSGVVTTLGSVDGNVETAAPVLHGKFPLPPQIPPLSFDGGTSGDEAEATSEELPRPILRHRTSKRASTSGSIPSREGRTGRTFKRLSFAA
ncbi:hypothetical protein EDC04DRAFT_2619093 [Pisolithus marmoratus]|nr:hypothetical protein EDC04DRAFT_2619093 [Pisolithus marmoratus]